jgi:hypothetical protein
MRNQGKVSVSFLFNVVAVLVEADAYGVSHFSDVLEFAGEATDQVNTVFCGKT